MPSLPYFSLRTYALFLLFFLASISALAADPGIGRGLDDTRRSLAGDQKSGSLLVYNIYTSDPSIQGGAAVNTDLSVTNVHSTQSAYVHLFFIANNCSVADSYICLTPNQTATFLASDVDPFVTGYIIAMATDGRTGCPINFNYLVGSESLKLASGFAASLNAESYSALYAGPLPGWTAGDPMATVNLDGLQYSAAPRMLAADRIRSSADGNSTMILFNSLNGNLAIGMRPIGEFAGAIFDDAEKGVSFRATGVCQFQAVLSDTFPKLDPVTKFAALIPKGRSGWMWLAATQDRAISGIELQFNPDTATSKTAFSGGRNLHHLRYGTASLQLPVFPPQC